MRRKKVILLIILVVNCLKTVNVIHVCSGRFSFASLVTQSSDMSTVLLPGGDLCQRVQLTGDVKSIRLQPNEVYFFFFKFISLLLLPLSLLLLPLLLKLASSTSRPFTCSLTWQQACLFV